MGDLKRLGVKIKQNLQLWSLISYITKKFHSDLTLSFNYF